VILNIQLQDRILQQLDGRHRLQLVLMLRLAGRMTPWVVQHQVLRGETAHVRQGLQLRCCSSFTASDL